MFQFALGHILERRIQRQTHAEGLGLLTAATDQDRALTPVALTQGVAHRTEQIAIIRLFDSLQTLCIHIDKSEQGGG